MQNPNCKYGGLCGKSVHYTSENIAAYGCNGMKNYSTTTRGKLSRYALQNLSSQTRKGRNVCISYIEIIS